MNAFATAVAILSIIAPLAWQAWHYADQKRQELRDKRFVTYHDLIRRLVEPDQPTAAIKLDRQVAVVYELRNFPEYGEVTVRILRGLRDSWSQNPSVTRLIKEIDITLAVLESHGLAKHRG